MTVVFFFKIFILLISLFGFSLADSFNYPRSTAELKFLEEISRTGPNTARLPDNERIEKMQEKLENELKKLKLRKSKNHANSEQLINLVNSYLGMSKLEEKDCTEKGMSELTFMVHFHSDLESSKEILFYVLYFAWKKFKVCRLMWDRIFYKTVSTKIDSFTRDLSNSLLDAMITTKLKMDAPNRPYSRQVLSKLMNDPSPGGIILFLSRNDDIMLDENMKNPDYSWEDFLESTDLTLMPLCQTVCKRLKPIAELYQFMLDPKLNRKQEVQLIYDTIGACFPEWMAKTQLCCKLVRDRENTLKDQDSLLKKAFNELSTE